METKLLHYFNEELNYLRHGVKKFAERYPHIGSRLHLGSEVMEDPHVTRLLEAFALLCGRIRCHQEDNFNQLCNSLLSSLFPHYAAPIPSLAIVQCEPDDGMTMATLLSRGQLLETLPINGEPLKFTTCYDTYLLPLSITHIAMRQHVNQSVLNSHNALAIHLATHDDQSCGTILSQANPRFFIREHTTQALILYEQLMTNCAGISIHDSATRELLIHLDPTHLKPVGFSPEEALLPWFDITAPRWRLLSEYFNFKEKFLFFELDLSTIDLSKAGKEIEILVHFSAPCPAALNYLSERSLTLNCVPVINLFKKTLEPLIIDGNQYEYPLRVDKNYPDHYEIHTIEEVSDISDPQNPLDISGLFQTSQADQKAILWSVQRKYHTLESHQISTVYLSLNEAQQKSNNEKKLLAIQATCFNSYLPNQLYLPDDSYHLQLAGSGPALTGIRFITQPTPVYQHHTGKHHSVGLIAQLAQNHLPLTDSKVAITHLKNLLSACNMSSLKENQIIIDSVLAVIPTQVLQRVSQNKLSPFAFGTELQVNLRRDHFSSSSANLFYKVLEKSFNLEVGLNTFLNWKFVME